MNASKLKYRSHLKRRVQRQALQSSDNDNEDVGQQHSAAVVSPLPDEQRGDLNNNGQLRRGQLLQHHQNVEMGGGSSDYDDKMQRAKEIILRRNTPPRRQGGANNFVKANDCSTPVNKSHQNSVMFVGGGESGGSTTRHVSPLQQLQLQSKKLEQQLQQHQQQRSPLQSKEPSGTIYPHRHYTTTTTTIPAHHHHHDDNMSLLSTSTSVLTDEAMDDHKLMMRNVRQWEHRRLMRSSMRQQQVQQQVQHQHQQHRQQRGQEYSRHYQNYPQSQRQSPKQQIQIWDRLSPILQQRESSMMKVGEVDDESRRGEGGLAMVDLVKGALHDEIMKKKQRQQQKKPPSVYQAQQQQHRHQQHHSSTTLGKLDRFITASTSGISSSSSSSPAANLVASAGGVVTPPKRGRHFSSSHHDDNLTNEQEEEVMMMMVSPDITGCIDDCSTANNVGAVQLQQQQQKEPPSPPPFNERASPIHSADAAAGKKMMLTNIISQQYDVDGVEESNEGVGRGEEEHGIISPPRRVSRAIGGGDGGGTPPSANTFSTPPSRTLAAAPNNGHGNRLPPTSPTLSSPQNQRRRRRQLNLEQRLGTLSTTANNAQQLLQRHQSSSNKSVVSMQASVVSAQPSIESECVRQNAEIVLAMEDAMISFMGGGIGENGLVAVAADATITPSSPTIDSVSTRRRQMPSSPSIESECVRQNSELVSSMMNYWSGGTGTVNDITPPSSDDDDYGETDDGGVYQQDSFEMEGEERLKGALHGLVVESKIVVEDEERDDEGGGFAEEEEEEEEEKKETYEEGYIGIRETLSQTELNALDSNGFSITLNRESGDGSGALKQSPHLFSSLAAGNSFRNMSSDGNAYISRLFSVDEVDEEDDEEDERGIFTVGSVDEDEKHQEKVERKEFFPTLLSMDEAGVSEYQYFGDPPLISGDSSSGGSESKGEKLLSSPKIDEFIVEELRSVVKKDQKKLGAFLDQLGSLIAGGNACQQIDADEESDVFQINNNEYNKSMEGNDEKSQVENVENDTINSPPPILPAQSFSGCSHTTVPRGNTAVAVRRSKLLESSYQKLSELPFTGLQFARHDIIHDTPDPDLILEIDDESEGGSDSGEFDRDDDESSAIGEESDNYAPPDPEPSTMYDNDVSEDGSEEDSVRGIDPEEGEAVLCRNRFEHRKLPDPDAGSTQLTLDDVKMSSRERLKGSSLHWQASNGVIMDEDVDFRRLSPSSRSQSKRSEEVASPNLRSMSASTAALQDHFGESKANNKLSPLYRRKGGGHSHIIDEAVEEDDEEDDAGEYVEDDGEDLLHQHEHFIQEFGSVVQDAADAAANIYESVQELVIGPVSESSPADDDEIFDFGEPAPSDQTKLQTASKRRIKPVKSPKRQPDIVHDDNVLWGGAAVRSSMGQVSYSRLQKHPHQPMNSRAAMQQSSHRAVAKQPSLRAMHGQQQKSPEPLPQPPEPRRVRLEDKLRDLGSPPKKSGDSVGTSELGSLMSSVVPVPKTIFHRTAPPSARSTPSSLQNTHDYSAQPPNQETQQRALNMLTRGLTPDVSLQLPVRRNHPSNGPGLIPIGSETWKLKQEFLDTSPLDPSPRQKSSPGFFPASRTDEDSHASDGFGRLNDNNGLGSLQVGSETWNLSYAPATNVQSQKVARRHHSEPVVVAPPVYRHPSRAPRPAKNDSRNSHPQRLVMKSVTENRDGTRVQNLSFIGREGSQSPQPVFHKQALPVPSSRSRPPTGATRRFQRFPSAIKIVSSAPPPSHYSQRANNQTVRRKSNQQLRHQGSSTGLRQASTNRMHPTQMNRSLDDKLKSMSTTNGGTKALAESSQVSGSVFEAVEVGSFGVQYTLFSKHEKPKDVNYHPVLPHPTPLIRVKDHPVVVKLNNYSQRSNRPRFTDKMKAMATKASQKLVVTPVGVGHSNNTVNENEKYRPSIIYGSNIGSTESSDEDIVLRSRLS
jgi:hypothetical protein